MAPSSFRIADGSVHVYRLFDVADAVDLVAAERNVSASSRLRLERAQSGAAIEIPRPPLHVHLGKRTLLLGSGPREAEARARVYDYGVVSVHYRLDVAPGTPLEALVPLSDVLAVTPTPRIDAEARREAHELAAALGSALERPHEWEGFETYQVIFVRAFEGGEAPRALLADAPIAELLLGETSPVPLSEGERSDVLANRFSYLADDLAVIDWNWPSCSSHPASPTSRTSSSSRPRSSSSSATTTRCSIASCTRSTASWSAADRGTRSRDATGSCETAPPRCSSS